MEILKNCLFIPLYIGGSFNSANKFNLLQTIYIFSNRCRHKCIVHAYEYCYIKSYIEKISSVINTIDMTFLAIKICFINCIITVSGYSEVI